MRTSLSRTGNISGAGTTDISMDVELYEHQRKALTKMKNGCILCGGVGSGKSRTSLAYFERLENRPNELYIITTARKRDDKEWEEELIPFQSLYSTQVVIDSWNNLHKYIGAKDAFFIFDEQRVVGSGAWVKAFLKITKNNRWILLSATPGDTWKDYIPVFVANGFYKNRTEFIEEHVVFSRFSKYPKIDRYLETGKLNRYRNSILVRMDFERNTVQHHEDVYADYDVLRYKSAIRDRWNIWTEKPIKNASEFCYVLRKIVNTDEDRVEKYLDICTRHPKVIVFYNFDYELEVLKSCRYMTGTVVAEWNGHLHEPVPDGERWVYLVQYTAGAEGWNCTKTDTIIFYSQNYSYKILTQSSGRIDRLNTPYTDLYYYHLKSRSGIDLAIAKAVSGKKRFNEAAFFEKG